MPTDTDTDTDTNPILAARDAEPDRVGLYRALLERWMQGPPITTPDGVSRTRSQALLANLLDFPPQRLTNWKSGESRGHIAPWWVLMWLCNEVQAQVIIAPTGCGILWPEEG